MVMGVCETGHVDRVRAKPYCVCILSYQPRRARLHGFVGVRDGKQDRSMSAAMKSSTSVRAATLATANGSDEAVVPMIVRFLDAVWMERGLSPNTLAAYRADELTNSPGSDGSLSLITPRERKVVQLVAEANTSKQVASLMGIGVKTVESHRTNIMRKLQLHSVTELVRYAIRNGIVQP